jgi:hypothetical protein
VRAAEPLSLSVRPYPVPGYVPAVVRPVLPWTRRHVARVAARYHASQDDLWDEAVTALLRASFHWQPALGAFGPYGRTAIHRACWRYVIRGHEHDPRLVPLEDAPLPLELAAPSAEDEAIAREAARRAWLLRQHAALADARGDNDTTSRLRDAASAAAMVARTVRRRPRARA